MTKKKGKIRNGYNIVCNGGQNKTQGLDFGDNDNLIAHTKECTRTGYPLEGTRSARKTDGRGGLKQ